MGWRLHSGSWNWTILEPSESAESPALLNFHERGSALVFLQPLQEDPFCMSVLRDLVVERHCTSDLSNIHDHRILELVAWELESGRLRVAEEFRPMPPIGRARAPVEDDTGDRPFTPPPESPTDEKTWIKFQILDSETGQPVAGVALTVKLTDGTIKKSTSDGSGVIEFRNIPPGSCSIESMSDTDALEVISMA
jgi:hypothetical protein